MCKQFQTMRGHSITNHTSARPAFFAIQNEPSIMWGTNHPLSRAAQHYALTQSQSIFKFAPQGHSRRIQAGTRRLTAQTVGEITIRLQQLLWQKWPS